VKYVRVSQDVWVNLDEVESITMNVDGTALLQGRQRIYESTVPIGAILMQTEEAKEPPPAEQAHVASPLLADTRPAW
jgi:hypothetical protein